MVNIIQSIRTASPIEEIDYNFLNGQLKSYSSPRDVITRLIKEGDIIRIKKGIYIFGERYARTPYYKEVLANMIYGPSYISLEYALSFYGLIPERVEIITSMTCKRNKVFNTPMGKFKYQYIHPERYSFGITQYYLDPLHAILIATKEKAICDKLVTVKGITSREELYDYLVEDLRMEHNSLTKMRRNFLRILARLYRKESINLFSELIGELK